MFDDFMVRAALAGIGVAFASAPLGCFVVWRRMAYFGDATAHAAILGVALSLAFSLSVFVGTVVVALLMALVVSVLSGKGYAMDTLLGVLAHSALAFGLVAVSFLSGIRIDLMAYLFGDILAVSRGDLSVIWGGASLVVALIGWRLIPSDRTSRRSAEESAPSTVITRNGMATNVFARITPHVENGKTNPVALASGSPTAPRRPKANSRAAPPTTGGSTSGKVTTARSSDRPRNSTRLSVQASGTPSTAAHRAAATDVISDNRSASTTTSSVSSEPRSVHGVTPNRPISGRTNSAAPITASTSRMAGGRRIWIRPRRIRHR